MVYFYYWIHDLCDATRYNDFKAQRATSGTSCVRDSGGRFDAVISVTAKLLSVCVDDSDVATTRVCVDFASNGADGAGISGKGISGEFELSDDGVTDPVNEGDLGSSKSGSSSGSCFSGTSGLSGSAST